MRRYHRSIRVGFLYTLRFSLHRTSSRIPLRILHLRLAEPTVKSSRTRTGSWCPTMIPAAVSLLLARIVKLNLLEQAGRSESLAYAIG